MLTIRGIVAAVSAVISIAIFQLWVGNSSYGMFPPVQGTMFNDVMQIVAIPFVPFVIVGGGLAAAYALSTDATSERQRLLLALSLDRAARNPLDQRPWVGARRSRCCRDFCGHCFCLCHEARARDDLVNAHPLRAGRSSVLPRWQPGKRPRRR
jgi:hypothetical protein